MNALGAYLVVLGVVMVFFDGLLPGILCISLGLIVLGY